ncbi:YciI family protein [Devosia sp. A16]|uniref:YciI family protein n=1 Tax=Devosia sp. A16 TaxID=1736675 RepID=UPI0006D789EC|nr:YciI family protein [Devosia sp. A16]
MRYMIILNNDPGMEQQTPTPELFAAMGQYNRALFDAGVLRAVEGLSNTRHDAQLTFSKGRRRVVDGPFTEAKELVGGFWIIETASKADALEWAARMPRIEGASIQVRRVSEIDDFKGAMPAEVIAEAEKLRAALAERGS